jgi:hypothetical protein
LKGVDWERTEKEIMNIHNTNQDLRSYTLKLSGTLDDDFVTSFCPSEIIVLRENETTNLSNIHTDQSGIIGLIRNLHNLGCTILSLNSESISLENSMPTLERNTT